MYPSRRMETIEASQKDQHSYPMSTLKTAISYWKIAIRTA